MIRLIEDHLFFGSLYVLRLYTSQFLENGATLLLDERCFHHACVVMRKNMSATFILFNDAQGEFLCRLVEKNKKNAHVHIEACIRPPISSPPLHLAFSPLRPERMAFLLEKATELGVTDFHPLTMQHTQNTKIPLQKWQDYTLQAVQQSERFTLPLVHPMKNFSDFLEALPNFNVFVAMERIPSQTHIILPSQALSTSPTLILIGPEGGFAEQEKNILQKTAITHPNIQCVNLGSFILRAETAALTMLALLQHAQHHGQSTQ